MIPILSPNRQAIYNSNPCLPPQKLETERIMARSSSDFSYLSGGDESSEESSGEHYTPSLTEMVGQVRIGQRGKRGVRTRGRGVRTRGGGVRTRGGNQTQGIQARRRRRIDVTPSGSGFTSIQNDDLSGNSFTPRVEEAEGAEEEGRRGQVRGYRMPKRRRMPMPFPSRVLYRNGSSSTHPAAVIAAGVRRLPSTGTSTPTSAGTAGALIPQPDSCESGDDKESYDDEEEVEIVTPKQAITSGGSAVGRVVSLSNSNKVISKDVVQSGSGGSTSERIAAILTDTDVLDCAVCFEPFTIPVYQCDNGHTACSSCCGKLQNKCPSCCLPIGYNRCHALEKVLEAAKITCSNSKYGCNEKVSYSMKCEHERSCVCEPCYCPNPLCDFNGSYKDVYLHFACKHPASVTRFTFDSPFPVRIGANMKFKFLQEQDNTLFVLNYGVQTIGNVANIICLGPSSLQKVYSYELEASNADSTVKLTSLTHSQPKWTMGFPQKSVLVIPKVFIAPSREHNIQICIRRKGEK